MKQCTSTARTVNPFSKNRPCRTRFHANPGRPIGTLNPMGNTITSFDRLDTGLPQFPDRATRSPQQINQGALVLETLRRDPPGVVVINPAKSSDG